MAGARGSEQRCRAQCAARLDCAAVEAPMQRSAPKGKGLEVGESFFGRSSTPGRLLAAASSTATSGSPPGTGMVRTAFDSAYCRLPCRSLEDERDCFVREGQAQNRSPSHPPQSL